MPTQLQTEMALSDAAEKERQTSISKSIADLAASQPSSRKPPSSSKEAAARGEDENVTESSNFSTQWKAVKFSSNEVAEGLKQEPSCERCLRFGTPCTNLKTNLICKECQIGKVTCSRRFNNTVRVLARKLGETEEEVRSKHARFMTPSTQKRKGTSNRGDGCVEANANAKAKRDEASATDTLKAKEKSKEKEKLPTIVIPGNRGSKSSGIEGDTSSKTPVEGSRLSEPRSQRANSRALLDNDERANEDELSLAMDVDTPVVLNAHSHRSNLELSQDNSSHTADQNLPTTVMGVDAPQLSKHQTQPSGSGVPPDDDNKMVNEAQNPSQMCVDTLSPSKSESLPFHSMTPQIPVTSKRQMWDYLSRPSLYELLEGLEAELILTREQLEEVRGTKDTLAVHLSSVTDGLEECRKRVKDLENSTALTITVADLENSRDALVRAQSDLQQVENQRLEGELELIELRKKVEVLEKHQALNKAQRSTDEARGLEQFGLADGWTAQDQERNEEISDRQRYPSLGAQSNLQGGNHNSIATLGGLLARRTRMFEEERDRRQELEAEVARLRSELGKAQLFSYLSSEYSTFVREVQTSIYALDTVESLVYRETYFNTKTFCSILDNLSEASTSAKERISVLEQGRYKLVGFIEQDDLNYNRFSPSPNQEKRGKKRKEREDDDQELRDQSVCWRGRY